MYLVYTLPVEDMPTAQRKLADFKRQNFENISIITTGRYRQGMSFGTHASEDEARTQIDALTTRGVRNLRVGRVEQSPAVGGFRYRFKVAESALPAAMRERYAALLAAGTLSPKACTP